MAQIYGLEERPLMMERGPGKTLKGCPSTPPSLMAIGPGLTESMLSSALRKAGVLKVALSGMRRLDIT